MDYDLVLPISKRDRVSCIAIENYGSRRAEKLEQGHSQLYFRQPQPPSSHFLQCCRTAPF